MIEVKRATELSLVDILVAALPGYRFYSSRGGGNEATPVWLPNNDYLAGDLIRSPDALVTKAIEVTTAGTSDSTPPVFTNVPGTVYTSTGPVVYETVDADAVVDEVDADSPEPPFGVVLVDASEQTVNFDTWLLHGHVVWVTSLDRQSVVLASQEVRAIMEVLHTIDGQYDEIRHLMIHGFDVLSSDEFSDSDRQARGDTISFAMGVSER